MIRVIMGVVLAVAMVGCGADLCAKQADCAKKSGDTFSETECRTADTTDREKAQSKGCGTQYNELAACIGSLTCDQLAAANILTSISANCGAKLNLYSKCME